MTDPAAVTCGHPRFAFGDTVAVDGVDLTVVPGEIFGLLGPNGAGKTTTIRADAGILAKLMVAPTPRAALVAGKAFAAGVRGMTNAVVVLLLALILGIGLIWNPLRLLAVGGVVLLGAAAFCCLSILIAGLVRTRERMMGIGQVIMVPLFFASNALYPVPLMPPWLQAVSTVNPLIYQVDALRGLLLGTPARYAVDLAVMSGVTVIMIAAAAALLPRLAR